LRWTAIGIKRRVRVVRQAGNDEDAGAVLAAMRSVIRTGAKGGEEEIEEIEHADGGGSPDPARGP
jgi:hypothetical protein